MMTPKSKKTILLTTIIISFIIILTSTFFFAEYLSRQNAPKKISQIINNIDLIDHTGKKFVSQTLKNQPSLIFFGFTHCPEVCPTTLSQLSEITDKLKTKIMTTNIIFITLDPKRDTQEHLKDYISNFNENVIGITGNIINIKKLADNWGVFYETINSSKDDYTLNHTATVFMLDKKGNYKGTISWGENENSIIQKIINLSKY
jgi:protein SCO1/2